MDKNQVSIIQDTSRNQTKRIKQPIIDQDYQKPHGGKVVADQPKKNDSLEWRRVQYYYSTKIVKNVNLKVKIDGKEYLKKNTSDFRLGDSFIFRTSDKRFDYDIRTGRFVPSGSTAGKVSSD